MALPAFIDTAGSPQAQPNTVSRSVAAARLGISYGSVTKLMRCGILPTPISADLVHKLAARPPLVVSEGELTVLRTGSKAPADRQKHPNDDREFIGFSMGHSDAELEETSLRWWRSDPDAVLDNQLWATCVATVPVAVYVIDGLEESMTRPDETRLRHHYAGRLIGRLHHDLEPDLRQNRPAHLRALAQQILTSRVYTSSGGPIAYLGRHERAED